MLLMVAPSGIRSLVMKVLHCFAFLVGVACHLALKIARLRLLVRCFWMLGRYLTASAWNGVLLSESRTT